MSTVPQPPEIHTLGELKAAGYQPRSVKDEIRSNLIQRLREGQPVFSGIHGYDDTVIPEFQSALLAKHNIILLGLRGQAKTRMVRQLMDLLDEWMPIVAESTIRDSPLEPISKQAKDLLAKHGDRTPIHWVHRSARYHEKLATPDVTISDLIGDVDPVKAMNERLDLSNEEAIHFGIIPRSNRGIFAINELPDLQPRIQVGLFNLLEENDIQIRGFPVRLPLDVMLVFTSNPEDYTNRGSIVTPLKDRIGSQIMTHYPKTLDDARRITQQEASLIRSGEVVDVPWMLQDIVEFVAMEARESEFVDHSSGVSARMTIAILDLMVSNAERRKLIAQEDNLSFRLIDLFQTAPAITGKVELVYEGEKEGPETVARYLIGKGVRRFFLEHFPDPLEADDPDLPSSNPYHEITRWFANGGEVTLTDSMPQADVDKHVQAVQGLAPMMDKVSKRGAHGTLLGEIVLEGLHQCSMLSKRIEGQSMSYREMLNFAMRRRRD